MTVHKLPLKTKEPRGCRWIDGDPRTENWHYCNKRAAKPGGSWCAEHLVRVYRGEEELARPNRAA